MFHIWRRWAQSLKRRIRQSYFPSPSTSCPPSLADNKQTNSCKCFCFCEYKLKYNMWSNFLVTFHPNSPRNNKRTNNICSICLNMTMMVNNRRGIFWAICHNATSLFSVTLLVCSVSHERVILFCSTAYPFKTRYSSYTLKRLVRPLVRHVFYPI